MMKKIYILIFLLNLLLISCYVNTTPVKSDYTVVEDTPPETSSSTPPSIDNNPEMNENYKEYTIHNVSSTTKVYVNTDNFFEKNDELEKYYRNQVENKKVIHKDTKEEKYRFDENLNVIKYNNDISTIYKRYIQSVLVRMSDKDFPLDGEYVVGAIYKIEKEDNITDSTDKYEILVYNNYRHYTINGKQYYIISIFNIPASDVSKNYNPENVYNGKYTFTQNPYWEWTIVPLDFK